MLLATALPISAKPLNFMLGQKQMLDIRYFCPSNTQSEQCREPVTQLPAELKKLIVQHQIGGVILFAENVASATQVKALIADLQGAVADAGLPPLFIAIDQEGGRVSRLPVSETNAFAGNMAIGASYARENTAFATRINTAIAKQLTAIGVNVNFAPTVDVNVNPLNPVINVRSYGESARVVSELGLAAVRALQENGIIAAMKHFPGHGDTHIDSHTGLPNVAHSRELIEQVDLLPFKQAINAPDNAHPKMIMTAHIQYPALDSSEFETRNGDKTILPATLSRTILTTLLREELGYKGIIVTDAMDMAGIAHYMAPAEALLQTFYAGADIALMPFTIRTPKDIIEYNQLMQSVQEQIGTQRAANASAGIGMVSASELAESVTRIQRLKESLVTKVKETSTPLPRFDQLESALAEAAITPVVQKVDLPIAAKPILMLMPDAARCAAMEAALHDVKLPVHACFSLANEIDTERVNTVLDGAAAVLIGDISPQHSMAEMGGMDDWVDWQNRIDKEAQYSIIRQVLERASQQQKIRIFAALRAPYVIERFAAHLDLALVTYDYRVYADSNAQPRGFMFDALAKVLAGHMGANGTLPVTVNGLLPE
ncbi:glycoside hydrolase family 3 N-terminal domain-containing protein [Alteromonas flava]|uniref:glycoside hydrolase family 3 N-terminal domain-containing protein n=1 Tax=Alteromonas flava TaxID=2048003 RepID=UPI0013DB7678|nr:glycoside hydrolase family 3 protein [Alteromonas flava]